jgi:quercetin dioxygenase-like cupin family protein
MSRSPDKTAEVLDPALARMIAASVRPSELSRGQRDSLRERLAARLWADQPEDTRTVRGNSVNWFSPIPNVWVKVLRQDVESNIQTMLLRIHPGGIVPAHEHTKEEECLVLEGELLIGDHLLSAGDLHIANAGAIHGDITTRTGALVMVRSEIPPPASDLR